MGKFCILRSKVPAKVKTHPFLEELRQFLRQTLGLILPEMPHAHEPPRMFQISKVACHKPSLPHGHEVAKHKAESPKPRSASSDPEILHSNEKPLSKIEKLGN
jgi:hypothetical protein